MTFVMDVEIASKIKKRLLSFPGLQEFLHSKLRILELHTDEKECSRSYSFFCTRERNHMPAMVQVDMEQSVELLQVLKDGQGGY